MWFELIPSSAIVTICMAAPTYCLWAIHKVGLGNVSQPRLRFVLIASIEHYVIYEASRPEMPLLAVSDSIFYWHRVAFQCYCFRLIPFTGLCSWIGGAMGSHHVHQRQTIDRRCIHMFGKCTKKSYISEIFNGLIEFILISGS